MFDANELADSLWRALVVTVLVAAIIGFGIGAVVFKGCGYVSEHLRIDWVETEPAPEPT